MNTYVLFIFGTFEDHEDITFFCMEILGTSPAIKSLKYVIENSQNIIVIFESELEQKELSEEIYSLSKKESVKFYFMFERETIITAHLPHEVKEFIYKPMPPEEVSAMKLDYIKPPKKELNLDDVLEKIENQGIDSLTEEEKNFIDNFEN